MLDPPGEMHSVFMLAESETDKTRWIGALNELHKILRKNRIPNKAVSKHRIPNKAVSEGTSSDCFDMPFCRGFLKSPNVLFCPEREL